MKQALPIVLLSIAISALVSFLVATAMRSDAQPVEAEVATPERQRALRADSDPDWTELRMALASLEAKVDALESGRTKPTRTALDVAPEAPSGTSLAASLAELDPRGEQALRAEVSRVIAQIEEEKEEQAHEEELVERRAEAVKANKEYDEVDLNLTESVGKLGNQLGLGSADLRDMKSLLALQNDRNREMTRMWSGGENSDEELGDIFKANRAKHRAEILALVGQGGIEGYRKFLRDGGLGGRFSFFTAPWEDWAEAE
ncbi:MAG: hypothetical protein GY711_12055 [bacterium]|nr:hypothetical protein [bacterium]